jgi:glycosyltransferase involved in cell wall biosynthesis
VTAPGSRELKTLCDPIQPDFDNGGGESRQPDGTRGDFGLADLNIAAFIAIRNGADYLHRTLPHLTRNGIRTVVIDNQSSDGLREIIDDYNRSGAAVTLEELPFHGRFDLSRQLQAKASLIDASDADWVLHLDVDEMPHSCQDGETLAGTIARAEAAGYNAINFEEFVFLPIDPEAHATAEQRHSYFPFAHYYFYEPFQRRLMRAWRRNCGFSNIRHGGHRLLGEDLQVFPENQVLRHYPFLSQEHAFEKYRHRRYDEAELARGWHGNRVDFPQESFSFPPAGELQMLQDLDQHGLDRSRPHAKHYWEWAGAR